MCQLDGSSPHTRGRHLEDLQNGIDNYGSSPHTRGRRSLLTFSAYSLFGSSPHTRGRHTRESKTGNQSGGSSPHTRGRPFAIAVAIKLILGSSPHTRGRRIRCAFVIVCYSVHPRIRGADSFALPGAFRLLRFIPAYAGQTLGALPLPRPHTVHPRIRGADLNSISPQRSHGGSSPHTRGRLAQKGMSQIHKRFIPAYAGQTCSRHYCVPCFIGSSPHTRGRH